MIKAGVKKGSKVLDIGCGRGDVSLLAADLVGSEGNVVGVDIDSGSKDVARKK
ncbi:MAG: methyltransferase domain-containing protein [Kordiimonadaceae bacterium]|nr:methyltransferase domain-containing protein [Kordiimonadaceae bacterium]